MHIIYASIIKRHIRLPGCMKIHEFPASVEFKGPVYIHIQNKMASLTLNDVHSTRNTHIQFKNVCVV